MVVLSLQGTSGGHGVYGSQGGFGGQGNPGVQGTPWASGGNYGTNSLGGSVGQGGDGRPLNYETNAQVESLPRPIPQPCSLTPPYLWILNSVSPSLQGAVAQPGYGSVRGNNQNSGVR